MRQVAEGSNVLARDAWSPNTVDCVVRFRCRPVRPIDDAEHDVLYLHIGEPSRGEGEETPEGHVIRYAPGTQRIVGLTMISPRHILERDGRLTVTIPETVETTAADLAPALAAV